MQVQPYLFFNGRCEEALNFYQEKLGAKILFLNRFNEAPAEHALSQSDPNKIMHATLQIGSSDIMASDGGSPALSSYSGFSLGLSVDDVASGKKIFDALAEGGKILKPWEPTFWTEGFGMLIDKFGIPWMINVKH